MKKLELHIKLLTLALLLSVTGVIRLQAQSSASQIDNTVKGYFNFADGQQDSVISTASVNIDQLSSLALSKTASLSNVVIGDIVSYRLIIRNTGSSTITTGSVIDSLPLKVTPLNWNRGEVVNGVFAWNITSLSAGAIDTAEIIARVNSDVPNNTYITNYAYAFDGQGNEVKDSVRIVAQTVVDYSCEMGITIEPKLVIGNGTSASVITAFISDTLGNPKPDGTPVYLKSSLGSSFFSNGKDSIVIYTQNGWVKDSLRALISGGQIFTAKVTVSISESNVCSKLDTLEVVFYPGAITGIVFNDDTDEPVENARIILTASNGRVIQNLTTKRDGRYLIPVPSTDVYTIRISAKDTLGQMINVSANVPVNVPSIGGLPPVYQPNLATGTMYYYLNRKPIPIAGLKLYMFRQNTNDGRLNLKTTSVKAELPIDSTFTNSQGMYQFLSPKKGTYEIVPADPTIRTSRIMHVPDSAGVYIINSNSPVVVDPNLILTKSGPSKAYATDTITYSITAQNTGTLPLSNSQLIDTLSQAMNFIYASNGGVYDASGHRVLWTIGKFDSLSSKNFMVDVSLRDSILANYFAVNKVVLTGDEIYPKNAEAHTQVVKANPLLSITKSASIDTIEAGGQFIYTLQINNEGNKPLTDAWLKDTIDTKYLTIISVNGQTVSNNIVNWTKAVLDTNEVDSVRIEVKVNADIPDEQQILNIAYAGSNETTSTIFKSQAIIHVRNSANPTPKPNLFIAKISSSDTVAVGDTVTYTIRIKNVGNVTLRNIAITDTLPQSLMPVSVVNATMNNRVVTRLFDSLVVSQSDSIIVKAKIPQNRPNKENIVNRVYGKSDETPKVQDTTVRIITRVNVASKSCRIHLTANPNELLGDGKEFALIKAYLSDTLGNAKPDGTPVLFRSPIGQFSNGLDSIIVPTVNGWAIDSLSADVTGIGIVNTFAKVSARDVDVCFAIDSVRILFYPGAIEGVVIDNRPPHNPVENALVEVFGTSSNNPYYSSYITKSDGYYLIPVPKSDLYRIKITVVDNFGENVNSETTIQVNVPERVKNENSISGKVYFYVSNKPIVARRVAIQLDSLGFSGSLPKSSSGNISKTTVNTSITDSTGTYIFRNVKPGKYQVATSDPYIKGEVNIAEMTKGKYIINANIPIVLNPNITFTKTGPSPVYAQDTITYTIIVRNNGNISIDSTVVTDSLDASMIFVSAGARSGASHNYSSGKVVWQVGRIDSVGGSDSLWIRVRFSDTLSTQSSSLTNSVYMTSDKTTRMNTSCTTLVINPELKITKQAMLKIVHIGDVATYKIKVTNNSPSMWLKNIRVSDYIPLGFKYVAGSTFIGSRKISDPQIGKEIVWTIADTLYPGASIEFVYRLVAGAGSAEGNGVNSARAYGQTPSGVWIRSILVSERIEVRKGIFTDHGVIIGKIFYDNNRNAYQDEFEEGVKDIELIMEDGTRIVTGDDGKFSLPDVLPGKHVIKVRKHTLPKNAELITGYNDFAGDPTSRFVNLTPAGIARADFYLSKITPDTFDISQSIAKVGNIVIQRIAQPRNVVFIEDEKMIPMKLSGLNFDVGKATLRQEAFPTLKQLAQILYDYPDITGTIVGHTDSSPIKTKEFPNNTVLSNARAFAVKKYLADKEGIDTTRIKTLGYGEFKPIATNKSKEGKAQNRRVEFYFGEFIEMPQRTASTIEFKIPICYNGDQLIKKLEFTDVLDERLIFDEGSALLNDSIAISPRVEGNKLHWTIDSIGNNCNSSITYRATINKPTEKQITLNSFTTGFNYQFSDTVITSDSLLQTTNEAAVAVRGKAVNYILSGVLFDVAKASLRSAAASALSSVVEVLKKDTTATVLIEGHTDSSPIRTKEFPSNRELSTARAKKVAMKLVTDFGISPTRLRWIGYGEYRPIATNKSSEGRQQNRRVEMRIFTKSFTQSVIQEGFADTSNTEIQRFVSRIEEDKFDTTKTGRVGDQFMVHLKLKRPISPKTVEVTVVDSLPNGLRLIEDSPKSISGIESLTHGKIIIAKCSVKEPQSSLCFRVEITDEAKVGEIIEHQFYIVRREKSGEVLIEKIKPIKIEVVDKNYRN